MTVSTVWAVTQPQRGPRSEVDSRFLLANERTLLAWVRTALALLASAGAVQEFAEVPARRQIAVLLAVVGISSAAAGGWRHRRTVLLLERGDPPRNGWAPVALAVAVSVIGIVLLVAIAAA